MKNTFTSRPIIVTFLIYHFTLKKALCELRVLCVNIK